jgi:glycosyltransferase involved in cell wall biosynthesis
MKVLQLSKFYPPQLGGIETVARDLSVGLVARGVAVEVLCANVQRVQAEDRDEHGVRVLRAASYGLWLSTSMAPGMAGLLKTMARGVDIVHVHMPDPMAAAAVWWARPRARVVLHWHSDVVRQRRAMRLYRPLQDWLLARADAVISTSRPYADTSAPLAPFLHKVAVVPIGTRAPEPPSADSIDGLQRWLGGRRLVFALGRLTYYKGYEVLIEAVRRLPADVVVVVAGGGPALAAYRAQAERAGVGTGVGTGGDGEQHGEGDGNGQRSEPARAHATLHFAGPMSAARVEAHFALASLFCLASTVRAEAYGVVVAEAMARGLPVVTTRIPGSGLNWLHQDGVTGLAVPPGDPLALAAAIGRLLADPAHARQLGEAGRARWRDHLQAQQMADATLALYRRVCGLPDMAVGRPAGSAPGMPDAGGAAPRTPASPVAQAGAERMP